MAYSKHIILVTQKTEMKKTPVAIKSTAISILLLALRRCEPASAKTVTQHTHKT